MSAAKGVKTTQKNKTNESFFCPVKDCSHHLKNPFRQKKNLKQHTLKVHTQKKYTCRGCSKKFPTETFLLAHERQCGKEFKCLECGWVFKSREALLMHGKRKGHKYEEISLEKPKMKKLLPKKTEQVHQSVQTTEITEQETPERRMTFTQTTQTCNESSRERIEATTSDSSSQTTFRKTPLSYLFDDSLSIFPGSFDGTLCNMETQTEARNVSYSQSGATGSADPLLYSHTYTQTCDEILSELGLTDVQTQTTWPPSDFQDFLVSTETQTSFTQCLEEEMAQFTTSYTQT